MGLDLLGFAYAATVAAGGIMGYAKAGMFYSNKKHAAGFLSTIVFINT